MKQPAIPMSLRAYAKLRGVSAMAVTRAVKGGRLSKSVVRDARGRPSIADPALADQEWDASTDLSRAPGYVRERAEARAGGGSAPAAGGKAARPPAPARPDEDQTLSLAEESAREKHWKANLAELECKEREGELVEAKLVEKKLADVFARCRTHLLAVPSRARQSLPHLSVTDVAALEDLVREALEELVEPESDGDDEVAAAEVAA